MSGQTIESTKYNAFVNDLVADANLARPVVKGGTGAVSATAARVALGLEIGVNVQAYSADISNLVTAWTPASASGPASLEFAEDTDNGVHKITVIAPASIASDKTATFQDITGTLYITGGTDVSVADGGTGSSTSAGAATNLGLGTGDSPQFTAVNVGAATDTTVSRGAAGFIAVEGNRVPSPASQAAGDILYRDTTEWARLAKGTAAQVLTMNAGATAPEWAAGGTSMTLLGTLTTTSGATQSLTGIAAGYRQLYCEVEGVSFTASTITLTLALSSTNGAAYGTARNISVAFGGASTSGSGAITIFNVSSVVIDAKAASSVMATSAGAATGVDAVLATNTAAVVDAIQFSGGTFDAGTIRVYGVK